MHYGKRSAKLFFTVGAIMAFLVLIPIVTFGQDYPNRPITLYVGYTAGATTDLTARGLAAGAEKMLGVPVVVENKVGGSGTVSATLIASKKPDGYTFAFIAGDVLTKLPHLMATSYNPLKDFTPILQYSRYPGGICVLSESPIKTIDQFIAYAKAHPGLTYGSSGMYSQMSLAAEFFAQCKGLQFKHIPYNGGADAITAMLGKQTDFIAGTGAHLRYVAQGTFRMLFVVNADKRDPSFPDIPVLKELGCEDCPANPVIVVGPKGVPDAIVKKVTDTFKEVAEGPEFQKLLSQIYLPYDFKDRAQLEKDIPAEYAWYKSFLQKVKVK